MLTHLNNIDQLIDQHRLDEGLAYLDGLIEYQTEQFPAMNEIIGNLTLILLLKLLNDLMFQLIIY